MYLFPVHLYRIKPEYVLLSGLWSGTKKPPMTTILQPLVSAMKSLAKNGAYVCIFYLAEKLHCIPYRIGIRKLCCTKVNNVLFVFLDYRMTLYIT